MKVKVMPFWDMWISADNKLEVIKEAGFGKEFAEMKDEDEIVEFLNNLFLDLADNVEYYVKEGIKEKVEELRYNEWIRFDDMSWRARKDDIQS